MRPVRVLHLIKTFGLGGAEMNLLNLASSMDPARVETHVGYSYGGEMEELFRRRSFQLFRYAEGSHRIKSLHTPLIAARLAGYVRRHGIRIIHTHNFNAHVWGCLAARLSGARVLEHVHDFRYCEPEDFKKRRGEVAQYRFIRYFKGWSNRIVVLTSQNQEYAVSQGYAPAERVHLIPNGIPLNETPLADRKAVREEWGWGDSDPLVFTAARMSPEKNIDLILRTAPSILAVLPNVRFLIIGDGPLLPDFRRQVQQAGLERAICLPGYRSDVRRLMAASDVFWLPSFLELHSIALLEALELGVAVLTAKGTGSNDDFLVDGQNARLLNPFSDEGWAEALLGMLTDSDVRAKLARAGRELCRLRFDIRQTACRFEELYEKTDA